MNKKIVNYNNIDMAKLIMAILVVAIHTGLVDAFSGDFAKKVCVQITDLAVPFFLIATGFLLGNRMSFPYKGSENAGILMKQFRKVLTIYVVWMTIYLPITIYVYFRNSLPLSQSLFLIVKGYILTGEQENAWHFWYLLSAVYALLIIALIVKIKAPAYILGIVSFLASVGGIILAILPGYEGNLPKVLLYLKFFMLSGFVNNRIMNGMIYIPIGMFLARVMLKGMGNYVLFIVSFIANLFIDNAAVDLYLLIAASVGLFGIIVNAKPDEKMSQKLDFSLFRNMSTYIYLIHMYVWTAYYKVVYGNEKYGLDVFVVTAVLSCVISYIICRLKINFKKSETFK